MLGASFNNSNMGVSALAAGTITCLLKQFPDPEIFLLDYGRESFQFDFRLKNGKIPIHFVNMRFSKKFYLRNNVAFLILLSLLLKLIPFRKTREKLISSNRWLRQIHDADLIASIAGGDSFSDTYGLGRLLYVSLPQFLALFLGKRLLLLPQTLGPFKGRVARTIAKYILRRAELIYSRDHAGIRETKLLLGPECNSVKLRFCYDVGFAVDPVAPASLDLIGLPEKRKQDSCVVGLNISGLLFMGGYTRDNMFGLSVEYDKLVCDLIDFLAQRKRAVILLIPHVFGEHSESDSIVCEKTYEAFRTKYPDRIGFVRGTYNQSEIKHIIGLCDFFIGSRMHACIAAVSQNIPAVAIAYSEKFAGVMHTIGIESLVVDARKMNKEEILHAIDQAYERREIIRRELEQKMPQVKEAVLNLFSGLNGFT